jgi:integrase
MILGKDLAGKELGPNYLQLPSGLYRFRYYDTAGDRQSLTNRTLKQLRTDAGNISSDISRGRYQDPALSQITLDVWFNKWIREHSGDLSTRSFYAQKYRLYIKPYLGKKRLCDLTVYEVTTWLGQLKRKGTISGSTQFHAYRTLSACLGYKGADGAGRLPQGTPCRKGMAPKHDTGEWYLLDEATEFQRLLECVGGEHEDGQRPMSEFWKQQHRQLIITLAFTALRFGEIAALRRYNVNPLGRTLQVEHGATYVSAEPDYDIVGGVVEDAPKGGGARTIPWLPDQAMDALNWQLDNATREDPESYVWTGPRGGQLKHNNWHRRVWLPTVQRAGLEGVRPHDLRHSAASWMHARGVSIKALQELLGHSSRQVTERYIHINSDQVAAELRAAYGVTEQAV